MTWINDIERELESRYSITPRITENYKTRYRRYNHRAVFFFERDDTEKAENIREATSLGWNYRFSFYERHDYKQVIKLKDAIVPKLGNSVKIRNEWYETLVYFENLDSFLSAVPAEQLENLIRLELMAPLAVSAKQNFSHDYPVELTVKPRLPFDKYRYRIYTATSSKVRRSIGTENLLSIYGSLKAYEGIYVPERFERYVERHWNPDTYFYSETLDWLPLIYMMDPRYIKRIEQFKTTEELEQDDTTA